MTCGDLVLTVHLLPAPSDPGQPQDRIPTPCDLISALKPLVPTFGVTWLKLQGQLTSATCMLELRPEVTALSLPWPDIPEQGRVPDLPEQDCGNGQLKFPAPIRCYNKE